jgi:CheY-like chemotaxis protein
MEILLVEDNPADIFLIQEALKQGKPDHGNLNVAMDGQEALALLRHEGRYTQIALPDLILLDLNLPKKDGRAVLAEIKEDPALRHIPVVILTSSEAPHDIFEAYLHYANCYIIKPLDLEQFFRVIRDTVNFWSKTVSLPS